jgi:methylenetetrahydrofolate reductase (NADPH)
MAVSFECFPPKTAAGLEKLRETWRDLAPFDPEFFSCTYGASGSTRDRTVATVREIRAAGYPAAPHLCAAGSTGAEITALLDQYARADVHDLVALRGDITPETARRGELSHASDLVAFIRAHTGQRFRIAVACYPECHPQAASLEDDVRHLRRKVEMGADWAITQYFYNTDAYFRFVDSCHSVGIDVPIVPGIMPIADVAQLMRFSETCGAEIPRWLRLRLHAFGEDTASVRSFGLDVVTDLCDRLLSGGAPGLHFYTLNRSDLSATICRRLAPWFSSLARSAAIGSELRV